MCVNCKGYFMHGIGVPETILLIFLWWMKRSLFSPLTLFSSRLIDSLLFDYINLQNPVINMQTAKQKIQQIVYFLSLCRYFHVNIPTPWIVWLLTFGSLLVSRVTFCWRAQPRCWTLGCKYLTLYVCLPLRHVQTLLTVLCWLLTSILTLLTLSTRTVNQECWST